MSESSPGNVSFWDWWVLNLKIGALSFGSSGRLLMYQEAVVRDKKWLPEDEFQEVLTITQVLPGPNLINLSLYLGLMLSGRAAALAGLMGLALPGALFVVALVTFLDFNQRDVRILFEGFSIASVVLFSIFIWRLFLGLKKIQGPVVKGELKVALRFLIGAGVAVASSMQVPLLWTLAAAGALGFLVEAAVP